jgi:ribose 5-phosphate isomerase B
MQNSIAIGCDPNAADLKKTITAHLLQTGYMVEDYGSDDIIYANTAQLLAAAVASGKHQRGILLCGTGLGMCLAANKVPGAYAVTCSDAYSTERSVLSNNANILTIGSEVVGPGLAKKIVDTWLGCSYVQGGRSQPKINRIYEIEKQYLTK